MDTSAPVPQSSPPQHPSPPPIQKEHTTQEWNRHRETIYRLYVTEDRTLSEVRRIMQQEYNFAATTAQFKSKTKFWNMRKNIPKRKMLKILRKNQQRQNQGRDTTFYFHGQQVSQSRLNLASERYRNELSEQIIGSPASFPIASISDVEYGTPQPPCSQLNSHSPRHMSIDFMLGTRTADGARSITPADSIQWLSPRSQAISELWNARSPQWSPRTPEHPRITEIPDVAPSSYPVSAAQTVMESNSPLDFFNNIQPQQSRSREEDVVDMCPSPGVDEDELLATSRDNLPLQHVTQGTDETHTPMPNACSESGAQDSCRLETHNVSSLQHGPSPSPHQTRSDEEQSSQPASVDKASLTQSDHLKKTLQHLQERHTENALESLSQAFGESQNTLDDLDTLNTIKSIGLILARKDDAKRALEFLVRALAGYERMCRKDGIREVLHVVGEISDKHGDYKTAQDYLIQSLEISEQAGDDLTTAATLNCLAHLAQDRQHHEVALDYYTRALAACEKAGDEFRGATSLLNMARLYQKQGRIEEAHHSSSQALTAFEKVGSDEGAAIALGSIARVFEFYKRYDEALQYYSQAVQRFEQAGDGMEMPIATALSDMGDICNRLERYDDALAYYNRAVIACEKGDNDLRATILQHMADIYKKQGNNTMARDHYVQSVAAYEDAGNSLNAATALVRLANTSEDQDKALEYFARAVDNFEQAAKDPAVAIASLEMENICENACDLGLTVSPAEVGNIYYMGAAFSLMAMGNICEKREQYDTALHHYRRSLATCNKVGNISRGAIALRRMAKIYEHQRDKTKAHDCYVQSLAAYEKIGSTEDVAVSLILLARIAENPGDALRYYDRAVEKIEETGTHCGMANCLLEMGDIFKQLERYDSAEEYYSRALTACEKSGEDDTVATALVNMGEISITQGRHKLALEFYARSLAVFEKLPNHLHYVPRVLFEMADICEVEGDSGAAKSYFTKSLAFFEEAGDIECAARCLERIAQILDRLGHPDEAYRNYSAAVNKYEMMNDIDQRIVSSRMGSVLNKMGVLLNNQGEGERALECHIRALAVKHGGHSQ
ncbi:TPR-like protein [Wilcoxina mikolae CBS 423.85]|nr:TPR-like protein [Wilcoxina mikolae CBS 423.85]